MELVVSLGLVGLLMVVLISGNIFVHKLLKNWSSGNILVEEREYLHSILAEQVGLCEKMVKDTAQKAVIFYCARDSVICRWENKKLTMEGKPAHRSEVLVEHVDILPFRMIGPLDSNTLPAEDIDETANLYRIEITLSYRGEEDESHSLVRNNRAFTRKHNKARAVVLSTGLFTH